MIISRLKNLPKLPSSIDEIKIEGEWAQTSNKERFLITDSRNEKDRSIVFSSKTGLEILSASKRWHADGTFETSTKFFYQFYIIHAWFKGAMFPCAFILLTGKDFAIYKMMISKLIEEALLNKFVLKPEEILIDFEHAAIKAFTHYFPDVTIMGCFFHFGQCLYRNLCLHGMKSQYANDEKLSSKNTVFVTK